MMVGLVSDSSYADSSTFAGLIGGDDPFGSEPRFDLPGLDGYIIAQRLQANGVDIPLIFYTGKPEDEVRAEIRRRGIRAAHIQKPPSIRGLVEKIKGVLGGGGRGSGRTPTCDIIPP